MDTPTRYRRFDFRGHTAIVLETDEELETFNMNYNAPDEAKARGYIYREFCSRKTVGAYVFNRHGVCLNPVVTFHYKTKSLYPWMKIEIALATEEPMGFSYGIRCMLSSCGWSSPVGDETDDLFPSKEEATIDGLRKMRDYIERSIDKSKAKLLKVIDEEIVKLSRIVEARGYFDAIITPNTSALRIIDYSQEPDKLVFQHAASGSLAARKEFFERCYRQIQETVARRPDITINRRMVTMIMEDSCLTDDKEFKDLQRLCEQAAEQWHEHHASKLNNSQMQLFFTV